MWGEHTHVIHWKLGHRIETVSWTPGMGMHEIPLRYRNARARQELTGATLAPKNSDTLAELQGRRPREQV